MGLTSRETTVLESYAEERARMWHSLLKSQDTEVTQALTKQNFVSLDCWETIDSHSAVLVMSPFVKKLSPCRHRLRLWRNRVYYRIPGLGHCDAECCKKEAPLEQLEQLIDGPGDTELSYHIGKVCQRSKPRLFLPKSFRS